MFTSQRKEKGNPGAMGIQILASAAVEMPQQGLSVSCSSSGKSRSFPPTPANVERKCERLGSYVLGRAHPSLPTFFPPIPMLLYKMAVHDQLLIGLLMCVLCDEFPVNPSPRITPPEIYHHPYPPTPCKAAEMIKNIK